MTTMRAKMTVQSIKRLGQPGYPWEELELACVYSNTPEDNSFSAATPIGSTKLSITNQALHGQFNPGDVFYVDFTPAT